MPRYRVISPYLDTATGQRREVGEIVTMSKASGDHLVAALCVVEVRESETAATAPRETATRKRGKPRA